MLLLFSDLPNFKNYGTVTISHLSYILLVSCATRSSRVKRPLALLLCYMHALPVLCVLLSFLSHFILFCPFVRNEVWKYISKPNDSNVVTCKLSPPPPLHKYVSVVYQPNWSWLYFLTIWSNGIQLHVSNFTHITPWNLTILKLFLTVPEDI